MKSIYFFLYGIINHRDLLVRTHSVPSLRSSDLGIRLEIAAFDHSEIVGERLVTASVGVAEVRPACDFKQLYRLADEALYDAKRGGRNRVAVQRHQDGVGRAPRREIAVSK